jgi:hypothetical protein
MSTTHQQLSSSNASRAQFSYDDQRLSRHQQTQRMESTPGVGSSDMPEAGAVAHSQQISSRVGGSFSAADTSNGQRRSHIQYGGNGSGGTEAVRAASSSAIKSEPSDVGGAADSKNCLAGNANEAVRTSVSSSPGSHMRSASGVCAGSKLMTSASSSAAMITAGACRDSTSAAQMQHGNDVVSRQHQHLQQQQQQQQQQADVGLGAVGTGSSGCSFTVSNLVQSGGEFNLGGVTSLTADAVSTGGHQMDVTGNGLVMNPHYHAVAMSTAAVADRSDLATLPSCFDPSSAAQWFTSNGAQHGSCFPSANTRMSSSAASTPDFYVHRLHQTMSQVVERPMSDGSPSSASSGYAPVPQTGYPTSAWYASGGAGPEANYGLSPTAGVLHEVFGDAATRMLSAQHHQYMAAAAAAAAARQSCAGPGTGGAVMTPTPAAFRSYYGCSTPGGIGSAVAAGGGYQPYAGEDCSAKY